MSLRRVILFGLIAANLLVVVTSAWQLYRSRVYYEERAETLTRNVTKAIELNVLAIVQAVDLALQSTVDDLERQLASGGISISASERLSTQLERRVPIIEAIRVSRANGDVLFGKGLTVGQTTSWADRHDFIFHRDHANSGLQITDPRVGRVAKKYIIGFSRRYNYPDGSFAGMVSAPVATESFNQLLSQFDVGTKGTVLLRDEARHLIARMPPLPNNVAGEVGNQVMSPDFRQLFDQGLSIATGFTSASPDGYRRIFTFQRVPGTLFVAIVATADVNYLADWWKNLYATLMLLLGGMVISALFGAMSLRILRRSERDSRLLRESQTFTTTILNSLTEHVSVIDAKGVITAVNAAWNQFAIENGATGLAQTSVGANYLSACVADMGTADGNEVSKMSLGIKAVLSGEQSHYTIEYPCHSPTKQRWFEMRVLPLSGLHEGAVLIHRDVTDRHLADGLIKASEERFRLLFDTSIDGILLTAPDGQIFAANRAACLMLQRTEAEILKAGRAGVVDTTDPGLKQSLEERRLTGRSSAEIVMVRKDGSKFPCEVSSSIYYDGHGNSRSSVVVRDISERKRIEAALLESESRMSAIFQLSPLGIVVGRLADGMILSVNDAALRLFDYALSDVMGKRSVADLAAYIYPEQREILLQKLTELGSAHSLEIDYRTRGGEAIVVDVSGCVININGEACVLAVLTDVTTRKLAVSKIQELAYHDALTQLPNRRLLSDRIHLVMAAMKRTRHHSAVIYLDLDNFKPLNDLHGHEMGDVLLIEAAQRLKACVRESDTVSRVGGDEFVVLLGELNSSMDGSMQQARAVAEKIVIALAVPYILTLQIEGQSGISIEHRCTASVGVAMLSPEDVDHKAVLAHADAAMYEAKRAGKNSIRFWSAAIPS